jgi:hypothetical protein
MIPCLPEALRAHADLIGRTDDPDTATALRWAADEIDRLRSLLGRRQGAAGASSMRPDEAGATSLP